MSKSPPFVIPSGAPQARRRGIALVPAGRPLDREDRDSSPPALRASARNDNVRQFLASAAVAAPLGMTGALLLVLGVSAARAQENPLPFAAGERLHYSVTARKLGTIGDGVMSVDGPVDVRGTPTLVLRSEVRARVGPIKTTERAES